MDGIQCPRCGGMTTYNNVHVSGWFRRYTCDAGFGEDNLEDKRLKWKTSKTLHCDDCGHKWQPSSTTTETKEQ